MTNCNLKWILIIACLLIVLMGLYLAFMREKKNIDKGSTDIQDGSGNIKEGSFTFKFAIGLFLILIGLVGAIYCSKTLPGCEDQKIEPVPGNKDSVSNGTGSQKPLNPEITKQKKKPQSVPPKFLWYELPNDPANSLSIIATATCDGCAPVTNVSSNWPNANVKASTAFSACELPVSSESYLTIESFKDPQDKTTGLRIKGYLKSLAGWGGKADPYRYSNSGFSINAASGFDVKETSSYCLMIVKHSNSGTREKGYPGSYKFSEIYPDWPSVLGSIITLESPSGQKFDLKATAGIPISEIGLWKIKINGSINFNSIWSENSGTLTFEQELRLKFVKRYSDGTCP
jgi:hypothetical protein